MPDEISLSLQPTAACQADRHTEASYSSATNAQTPGTTW